jgi:hypothetical protein
MEPTPAEQQRREEIALASQLGVDIPTARQMLANRQIQDTRILQKVNRIHRDAFTEKFPGQVEHCLRLVMERLQAGLDKRGSVDIAAPDTWILTTAEIADLSEAAERLHNIRREL